ncbi:gamma-butyrolactone-binding protein [Streptomyces sulfonofaciens]|uniref:Gamma-butyrolactone-binding protein n=2 Tax=Streptomyces sulfonofaciens TaxID=68272 RepID=A0A919L5V1_9ACTN|nr:gamma-butyrolactone-binding protein [Streptomyces sulfonofaciens]
MGQAGTREERAAETRAALLDAAAVEFAGYGYAGASVDRIARRADRSTGSLYHHYPGGKKELAELIVRGQPGAVQVQGPAVGLQHLIDITLAWACQMVDNPVLLAGARLVGEQGDFIKGSDDFNSHAQWTEVVMASLLAARRRRELRAGVDMQGTARLLVNACTGAQLQASMESGPARVDLPGRVVEAWECLLPALAVPRVVKNLDLDVDRVRTGSAPLPVHPAAGGAAGSGAQGGGSAAI